MASEIYRKKDREQVTATDYYCGEIIAVGEPYESWYGERWVCVTEDDIEQLKAGKMFYISDGEYATCIVYREEKGEENE